MPLNPYPAERESRNDKAAILPKVVLQSLQVKQQIINQLIEGRIELWEATARFHVAHRTAAACISQATGVPVASTDSENLCRTVIGWVYLTLSNRPEEAERVTARLERDLQQYLESTAPTKLAT